MSLKDKWSEEELRLNDITNDDMLCKDCMNKLEVASSCLFYNVKPSKVIYGEKECEFYEKE